MRHALLAYLLDNADARDTLAGIVEWWLLDRNIRQNVTEVKQILDEFVGEELVLESQTADRRIHYRVNHRKEKEIRELLSAREV